MFQADPRLTAGSAIMPNDQAVTIYFYRNDGECERVALAHGTISEAVTAIHAVFYISEGLCTRAEVCRGNELIETVKNPLVRSL